MVRTYYYLIILFNSYLHVKSKYYDEIDRQTGKQKDRQMAYYDPYRVSSIRITVRTYCYIFSVKPYHSQSVPILR